MIFQVFLNELFIVEDLDEILFWIVIKLRKRRGTIVRKSWKQIPPLLPWPPWEKNLKRRLIFSFYEDLNIFAKLGLYYRCLWWIILLKLGLSNRSRTIEKVVLPSSHSCERKEENFLNLFCWPQLFLTDQSISNEGWGFQDLKLHLQWHTISWHFLKSLLGNSQTISSNTITHTINILNQKQKENTRQK